MNTTAPEVIEQRKFGTAMAILIALLVFALSVKEKK